MKILLINVVYGCGSTGIIVNNLYDYYLSKGHDVYVIYGRGKKTINNDHIFRCAYQLESKINHALSLLTGNLYGGMFFSTRRIIRAIKKINPDAIHLHCLNGYFVNIYGLLSFLKSTNIKVTLTNHADFMFTANCGFTLSCNKWKSDECRDCKRVREFAGKYSLNKTHHYYLKLKQSLMSFDNLIITGVSPWLTKRINLSPLYKNNKTETILNPICLNFDLLGENPYSSLLKQFGKKKVALFICNQPNNPEKGMPSFIELSKMMIDSDYLFVLIGSSLPQSKYFNIYSFGTVNNNDLVNFYRFADATLLLSKQETFSMVVAESLCSGTPIVGFLSGGPESISISNYSFFVENGNLNAIKEKLSSDLIPFSDKKKKVVSEEAIKKYTIKTIGDQYLDLWK